MKTIQLIRDKNFDVDFKKLKSLIEARCAYLKVEIIDDNYSFDERLIEFDKTHVKHKSHFRKKIKSEVVILGTDVPYDNNFFFEEYDGFIPISFYSWEALTDLPKENGMLYWICDRALSALQLNNTQHYETTGCINDFLIDKTGIDTGMRQANLCPKCLHSLLKKNFSKNEKQLL